MFAQTSRLIPYDVEIAVVAWPTLHDVICFARSACLATLLEDPLCVCCLRLVDLVAVFASRVALPRYFRTSVFRCKGRANVPFRAIYFAQKMRENV